MFHGMTWLEASVSVAAAILRTKVIRGGADEVAVSFYNTKEAKNSKDMELVYTIVDMGPPDAGRVLQLKNFTQKDFDRKIGAAPAEENNLAVDNALAVANDLLPGRPKTGAYIEQRAVFFTRDASPGPLRGSMTGQADSIGSKGGLLQLAPLTNPGEGFDLSEIWCELLAKAATSHPDASNLNQPVGFSQQQKIGYDENEENVLSMETLGSVVRMRAYRKRAITRITWTLGPGGATIGVKLYATMSTAWPAAKGTPVKVDASDNQILVRAKPTLLDAQTGIPLEQGQTARLYYPSKPVVSFPTRYAQDADEIKQLKSPATKVLSLLGFKPMSDLAPWHQLREATFVFPDEVKVPGSLVAFSALLEAMLEGNVMAVCCLVRGPSAEPRLVALLPQREVTSEDTGTMITPAGMNMIYLPFADDMRYPELDSSFTGVEKPQPTQAAVDVAAEMIASLDLGDDFDPADIPNPHMQHWLKTVEDKAIALYAENEDGGSDDEEDKGAASGEEEEEDDDEDLAMKEAETAAKDKGIEDLAVPNAEAFAAVDDLVDRFIAAVCAPGNEGNLLGQPKKQGVKRPAGSSAPKLFGDDLAAAVDALDVPGKVAQGKLTSLKNDDLKLYCGHHGLKKTGNKAELVERIEAHLKNQK